MFAGVPIDEPDEAFGDCRRYPPQSNVLHVIEMIRQGRAAEVDYTSRWANPKTHHWQWCGEYAPARDSRLDADISNTDALLGKFPWLTAVAEKTIRRLGVKTIRELAAKSENEILGVRQVGIVTLDNLRRLLREHGTDFTGAEPVSA